MNEPDAKEPHDYSSWPPHVHHYKREIASYVRRYLDNVKPFGPTLRDGLACLAVIDADRELTPAPVQREPEDGEQDESVDHG